MNKVLKRIVETGQFEGPKGQTLSVRAHILQDQGEYLQRIVREVNPTISIETGFAYGISAMYICDALKISPETKHIVIDSHQNTEVWDFGAGLNNLKSAGYGDVVELYEVESQIALPQLDASGLKIDFAFIDGGHTFDACLLDFLYIDRMLRVGGIVVFDDTNWPSVEKACRFILSNRNYSLYSSLAPINRQKLSTKRKLLIRAARMASRYSNGVKRLFNPEIFVDEKDFGPKMSRSLALRKEADDTRGYSQNDINHYDF